MFSTSTRTFYLTVPFCQRSSAINRFTVNISGVSMFRWNGLDVELRRMQKC